MLAELYTSTTVEAFPWFRPGVADAVGGSSWVVQASQILDDPDLILDAKRRSAKLQTVVAQIRQHPHVQLGDVLQPVQRKWKKQPSTEYDYVEIDQIFENFGSYVIQRVKGWALPSRAKLAALPGDIFIANIWSSAGKWLIADDRAADGKLLVTSGCTQFELRPDSGVDLADIVFGLSSEAFRVQMRGLATGSDGLSSVTTEDLLSIVIPKATSGAVRDKIAVRIEENSSGQGALTHLVEQELRAKLPDVFVKRRSSHVAQV